MTVELDREFYRAIKLHVVNEGLTVRGFFEKHARAALTAAGALPQAEVARAELLAIADEIGLDRALAALRDATRSAA